MARLEWGEEGGWERKGHEARRVEKPSTDGKKPTKLEMSILGEMEGYLRRYEDDHSNPV